MHTLPLTAATPDDTLELLRVAIGGDVVAPSDRGYDAARRAFNLALDQRPALIAFAESPRDVVEIVRYARSAGMRVAPRATGHGAAPLDDLGDAILLKTSRMRRVQVDPVSRTARVEAGAEWRDLTVRASEHGLSGLAGTAADVGVVGYTLGGGVGWLARRHGLAAGSVRAAEIVTADGRHVRADADNEPDLFWALRGGGGSFGVVTAIEIALYPVREAYAGTLFFPIDRSAEVLHAWRQWTSTVPDEVTSVGRIMQFPPLPQLPEQLRGNSYVLVEAAYLGDELEGAELMRPLRRLGPAIDTFRMMTAPELQQLHMDPPEPVPAAGDGMLLADLSAGAIEALVATAGPDSGSPLVSLELRQLGGALARPAGGGALARLDAGYSLFAVGTAMTPETGEAAASHVRVVKQTLAHWRAEHDFYNFADTPAEADRFFPHDSYRRLREIKAKYDPHELIVSAHPVRPAR